MPNQTNSLGRIRTRLRRLKNDIQFIKVQLITKEEEVKKLNKELKLYQDICEHEGILKERDFTPTGDENTRYDLYICRMCGADIVVEEELE